MVFLLLPSYVLQQMTCYISFYNLINLEYILKYELKCRMPGMCHSLITTTFLFPCGNI